MKTRRYHASPHRPTFARISNSYAVCRRWPPHHQLKIPTNSPVGIFLPAAASQCVNQFGYAAVFKVVNQPYGAAGLRCGQYTRAAFREFGLLQRASSTGEGSIE